jgi:pyruvate dehydrogenase E1 component alpha subunit
MYRARLVADGVAAARLDAIEADARAEIDEATEAAKNGPVPGPEELLADTWADGTSTWRN